MKKEKVNYPVATMSKVLGVSSSGYYKWLNKTEDNSLKNKKINTLIKGVFENSMQTYGSPRIAIDLKKLNIQISKSSVARRMNSLNLIARPKRKFVTTTDSNHSLKISDNLLDRNFNVDQINKVWVSDITYIRVANKWMYLTTFIDLADRMVVGWTISDNMSAKDTVVASFNKAIKNRGITKFDQLMVHSDRGVQYASHEFRSQLSTYNCLQSMSRKGNCWDNAVAESFFKTIKIESLNKYIFSNVSMLNTVVFRYINGWYNTVRIHSSLGNMSPLEASLKIKANFAA